MSKETKKWWEETSAVYQKQSAIAPGIHYGPGAPYEDELKLLGDLEGKHILEIGCGGAQCGIAMAKKGAHVTGVDISEEQLKFAKTLAKKSNVNITFYRGDIKKLPQIKSASQDVVFTAWAMQYVDPLDSCFREVYRILKKNGIFILAMPHPTYHTVNYKNLKLHESYFVTGKKVEPVKWKDGTIHNFVCYERTFSEITNALITSKLIIEQVIEPDSRKHYKKDPWYNMWHFTPKLMKYLPPTIIFKCRKR